MQSRSRRSGPELRGPRNGPKKLVLEVPEGCVLHHSSSRFRIRRRMRGWRGSATEKSRNTPTLQSAVS
eukprot:796904-Alexandrium_andersonii.AAC.1